MICQDPELAAKIDGHQHWIDSDDVDEQYSIHQSLGASIIAGIEDKPWGSREYTVEDPNGYHLRFTGSPRYQSESKPFPAGVSLERRKPTIKEYVEVAGTAFNYKEVGSDLLERTWNGVVARSPDGESIAMLRIMWDAPGWFSIWDVAVLPSWQAQGVGTEVMREALKAIKEVSPGANVHLFTAKQGFYERLGFGKESVSMIRL